MKKITLALTSLFISAQWSAAQITITSADLVQAGYIYLTSTDTTPTISLGTPSASSQNWNFNSLTQDYPSVPRFNLTSSTPYAGIFTASNLYTYGPAALFGGFAGGAPVGSQGMSKGYMFWSTSISGYKIIGFRADSGSYAALNVFVNSPELLIGTPCTYNTSFNNISRWEVPVSTVNSADPDTFYAHYVTKTLISDAWGSLTTPYGTFSNILRVHEHIVTVDSAYDRIGATVYYSMELTRDTSNNYLYLANGINYPAARVHADKNNVVKSVEYYKGFLIDGVNDNFNASLSTVRIFPNPLTDKTTVELLSDVSNVKKYTLEIFNSLGMKVNEYQLTERETFLNDITLPSGLYFYKVSGKDITTQTGKIIVQ